MGHSIQEYLKKINSRLSRTDTVSIAATAVFLILSALYFSWLFKSQRKQIIYRAEIVEKNQEAVDQKPFGSRNGSTYTYSWCQGSDRIRPANKIYFTSSNEAENSGRTLSKLCQK